MILAIQVGFSKTELLIDESDGIVSLMIVKEGDSEINIPVEVLLEDDTTAGMWLKAKRQSSPPSFHETASSAL